MLAVAGLGVVTSVALMREAHIAPVEDSRSLAYAGPVTWNEFYDPDAILEGWSALYHVDPREMFGQIDALVLLAPSSPETRGFLNAERISWASSGVSSMLVMAEA